MHNELINGKGSVAVNLAHEQTRLFMSWQRAAVDERFLVCAETDPHITLIQGVAPDIDIDAVRAALQGQGAAVATVDSFIILREVQPGVDVIALRVHSADITKMRAKLTVAFGDTREDSEFVAHITLAYVRAESHKFLDGVQCESKQLLFDEVRVRNDDADDADTFPLNYEEADDDDD